MAKRVGQSRFQGMILLLGIAFLIFMAGQMAPSVYADSDPIGSNPPLNAIEDTTDTGTGGVFDIEPDAPANSSTMDIVLLAIKILT